MLRDDARHDFAEIEAGSETQQRIGSTFRLASPACQVTFKCWVSSTNRWTVYIIAARVPLMHLLSAQQVAISLVAREQRGSGIAPQQEESLSGA